MMGSQTSFYDGNWWEMVGFWIYLKIELMRLADGLSWSCKREESWRWTGIFLWAVRWMELPELKWENPQWRGFGGDKDCVFVCDASWTSRQLWVQESLGSRLSSHQYIDGILIWEADWEGEGDPNLWSISVVKFGGAEN